MLVVHCKKWLSIFPSPAGMSLTKLFLAGFPARESLVSDILAGEGKMDNLFYSVVKTVAYRAIIFNRNMTTQPLRRSHLLNGQARAGAEASGGGGSWPAVGGS
jgi:hypothetical protein